MTLTVRRTQEEIVTHVREVLDSGNDFFGAESADLIGALDFEHARPFLAAETTEQAWADHPRGDAVAERAVDYIPFAINKILNHRGLSTNRSISHLRAWVWLLLDDEAFARFDKAEYENYGAPKVKLFCELIGRPELWPQGDVRLERMAASRPCEDDCEIGCGR